MRIILKLSSQQNLPNSFRFHIYKNIGLYVENNTANWLSKASNEKQHTHYFRQTAF